MMKPCCTFHTGLVVDEWDSTCMKVRCWRVTVQIKAQEAARYASELEAAQREAALEKQRRKEAYAQCVPTQCSCKSATKHGHIVQMGTAPGTLLLSEMSASPRGSHSSPLGLLNVKS